MMIAEWKKNFAIMWATQFIGMSAITGMISFLPLYVTVWGITDPSEVAMWSGILMGAASFCAALSNPYWAQSLPPVWAESASVFPINKS